jgi:putative phosphoribosyl transferase
MLLQYENRTQAGRALAERLAEYRDRGDVLVLGLPRGGVPVAFEVAQSLGAELDVMVVRKVGYPGMKELAMGAVAMGGGLFLNPQVADEGMEEMFAAAARREMMEVERRIRAYRRDRPRPNMRDRTVILVDDGLATGATMRAAIQSVREQAPRKIVVAVPVAPASTVRELWKEADDVVCPHVPELFWAIGQFYADFAQVGDDEVKDLLDRAWSGAEAGERWIDEHQVKVRLKGLTLEGSLSVPAKARGIVLFAHGSGSSRHSPRNRAVARSLTDAGIATLLFDLLTPEEEQIDALTREHRFDIPLLSERLIGSIDWVLSDQRTAGLPVGLFGASTGAAAALIAAAQRKEVVRAVVSRGGRPDLAGDWLPAVAAPTLLIVGARDEEVIDLNREAAQRMNAEVGIELVAGATHLFEEPGTLERVAGLARRWFQRWLGPEVAEEHAGLQA